MIKDGYLDSSVFNFLMMEEGVVGEGFGPYQISHDANTRLVHEGWKDVELAIYGLAAYTLTCSLVSASPHGSINALLSKEADWGALLFISEGA